MSIVSLLKLSGQLLSRKAESECVDFDGNKYQYVTLTPEEVDFIKGYKAFNDLWFEVSTLDPAVLSSDEDVARYIDFLKGRKDIAVNFVDYIADEFYFDTCSNFSYISTLTDIKMFCVSKTADLYFYYVANVTPTNTPFTVDLLKAYDGEGGLGVYVVDALSEDNVETLSELIHDLQYDALEQGNLTLVLGKYTGEYYECLENIHFEHQLILKDVTPSNTQILTTVKLTTESLDDLVKPYILS